jgi:hypothetical protein
VSSTTAPPILENGQIVSKATICPFSAAWPGREGGSRDGSTLDRYGAAVQQMVEGLVGVTAPLGVALPPDAQDPPDAITMAFTYGVLMVP